MSIHVSTTNIGIATRLLVILSLCSSSYSETFRSSSIIMQIVAESRNSATNALKHAQCQNNKGVFDFGYVKRNSKHRVTFRVFNNGDKDIRIRRTRSECACMSVAEAVNIVPANGYADIIVDFEAPDESVKYSKRIILQTYDPKNRYISLRVNADVDLPLKVSPAEIDAGDLAAGQVAELKALILNRGGKDIKLAFATSSDAGRIAKIPTEAVPAGSELVIPIELTAAEKAGVHHSLVKIHTGLDSQKSLNITIKYNVADNAGGNPEAYDQSSGKVSNQN